MRASLRVAPIGRRIRDVTALHSCIVPLFRDTLAPAIRSGITLELRYEVGDQSFASGTPATWGAHNGGHQTGYRI
jgi:hypothetical protein